VASNCNISRLSKNNLVWDFYIGLNGKELLLHCHDDVWKRSLKQECFEMSPE